MRPRLDPGTLAGAIAVLAALALLSPGVRVVRAGDAASGASPADAGRVCSVDDGPPHPPGARAARSDDAQRHQVRWVQTAAPEQVIPLNTRGYNHDAPLLTDRAIERMRRRQPR